MREYFLKIRSSWPGGEKVVPVHSKDSALRNIFRKKVLQMTEADEQRYWNAAMVKKGIKPVAAVQSNLKATFFVKGAITYVYRKDFHGSAVKVLLVIPAN